VIRGGCWYLHGKSCRSAYRNKRMPTDRSRFNGLRVVLIPPGSDLSTAGQIETNVQSAVQSLENAGRQSGSSAKKPSAEKPDKRSARKAQRQARKRNRKK
jgi:hypothetical protein